MNVHEIPPLCRDPCAELTTGRAAATARSVPVDRAHLRIDDTGIAGSHGDVDATEVVGAACRRTGAAAIGRSATCNRIVTRNAAASIHVRAGGMGLPLTDVPKTKPFVLLAMEVKVGQPLAGMVAL